MSANRGDEAQQRTQSGPTTKVVAVTVVVGSERVEIPVADLMKLELMSPTGVPFPAVAVRRGEQIVRYLGFPVIVVDEVSRIELLK